MDSLSKEFYWDLGNRIRKIRQEKHYSVEEFSEMVGISTKYMYQIENGRVSFSTEILYRIAHSLQVSINELLDEKNDLDISNSILLKLLGEFTKEEKDYLKKIL